MKKLTLYSLAAFLFFAVGGCKKQEVSAPETCAPASAIVKTVTATEGRVQFDTQVSQYVVTVALPNVTNSQDVGVLCTPLPTALQVSGLKVIFSGTYSQYVPAPSSGDIIYYHLAISEINAK